ncbi:hypothetical protein [Ammonifex thiophilus]|uniref:Uncharacterized protein n=1 Tax=Ammonifex thiophilus TaxID=444093 RepID=A0A3D8P317_9THEO|nr:hypothetical protein [Ammonifex thiophilus]RDV80961.1 hypothetical protein DXX99_10070 [Ammonifex thiophilus]
MSYTAEELRAKLVEMYPELKKCDIAVDLEFDEGRDAWVVTFKKGTAQRHAFLAKKDADACMEGRVCIYLGVLIAQYVKDMEEELRCV